MDKVKIITQTASKMRNTKMMETRAAKQKSPAKEVSMTEDSPCRKRIRSEVRDAKIKQAEKVNRLRSKKFLKHDRKIHWR